MQLEIEFTKEILKILDRTIQDLQRLLAQIKSEKESSEAYKVSIKNRDN